MRNGKLRFVVLVAVVVAIVTVIWAAPTVFAQTPLEPQPPESSAFFIGEGGQENSLFVGDVVAQTQRLPDGSCGAHSFSVGGSGDVKSISVNFDQSRCAMVVTEIVLDSTAGELKALIQAEAEWAESSTTSVAGAEWRVQAEGEWRGALQEVLTQAIASLEFKTASLTGGGALFDRHVASPDCWANYNPPFFNWTEDSCTSVGSASGPGFMSSEISGTFHHAVHLWTHELRSTAKASGWQSIPAAFDWDCYSIGHVTWPASFHCEKTWELISWQ